MSAPAIRQCLCPAGLATNPNRPMRAIGHITIHNTGNYAAGADAARHAAYQLSGAGGRKASWHYTADAGGIWQSYEDQRECWHTGTAAGNAASIGIEICVHDRAGFYNACDNAAWLAAALCARHGLPLSRVVQHFSWSGKDCPAELRSGAWGVTWGGFMAMAARHAAAAPGGGAGPALALPGAGARLAAAVAALHGKGVVQSPEYWLANAGRLAFLPELLESMARYAESRP